MRIQKIFVFIFCLFVLSGCGVSQDNEDTVADEYEPEKLLDAFLASEIPAIFDDGDELVIMYDQLPHDEDDWECYSVGTD